MLYSRATRTPLFGHEPVVISDNVQSIRENIHKVVVGTDQAIDLALTAILCEGHLLIEDVPGIGKTTLARALAASLGASFSRIQCTPDLLPSDVVGVNWFNQKEQAFEYRAGPVMNQVVLADEINRATPRTQSALLEAMQERQVTVDGVSRPVPRPFLVIATQNPVELEGTFPLPEAQLDRFMLRLALGYPDPDEEAEILVRFNGGQPELDLNPVVSADDVESMRLERQGIKVDPSVRDYIIGIARATRTHTEIDLGASPRATLALYQSAQAWAALQGRDYVLPDDAKWMAPFVLTHRLMIAPQAQLRGRTPDELLTDIISEVPVPVEG
jgi:MoxR-like ATPase